MTFQRISFEEKRGCVASGQRGAGPGTGGGDRGEKKKNTYCVLIVIVSHVV